MDVRAAKEVDIDHLARLWYDGWQDTHARILPVELARHRTLENFRYKLRAALSIVRVTGPPGQPVGFFMVKDDELNQLYVSAPARGSGLAAALLGAAEALLAANGVENAWLACAIGNDRAAKFYEKNVFLRWVGVRSRKKCALADESSQSIASCGNGWPNWLLFQMKR